MVVAAKNKVDVLGLAREAGVVRLAHVCEGDDEVAGVLVAQEGGVAVGGGDVVDKLVVGGVDLVKGDEPVLAGKPHEAEAEAAALEDAKVVDGTHGAGGGALGDVGHEPREVGLGDAGLHDGQPAVEFVVADARHVDAHGVKHRRHLGAVR